MFITLKCTKDNVSVEQASASTAQGTRPQHAACTQCRTKKLKCSGNREGCANCAANDVECIYPQPNRTSNGTAKRSRPAAHATRPRAVTQPGASKLSASSRTPDPQPPTPPLTTSASTTPLDSGITSNPWGADLALASGDISGFLESFWTESPTSLEDRFEDNAESFLPDLGSDAFQCHESLSTNDHFLQPSVAEALAALSSEILQDQSLGVTVPDHLGHQGNTSPTMALPALSEVDTMAFPELPDIAQISITNSCRCMTEALVILDRIETQKTEDSSSHLGMLTINKNAVSQCTRVLECLSCQSRPGCALLLILICRNLVSQFQQLLFGDWDASTSPDNPSPAGSINSDRSASLGQYSIDTSEEQRQVLHALSIVRGRNLAIFLDRLKRFVGNQGRASHMEKVGRIEIWHRSSMERLRQLSYEQI